MPDNADGLSRRNVLMTAPAAAGALAREASVLADPARRLFVQIFDTAEGGFGVNGPGLRDAQQTTRRIDQSGAGPVVRPGDVAELPHRAGC